MLSHYPTIRFESEYPMLAANPSSVFLDANQGVITKSRMAKDDEEKTAIHTSHGVPIAITNMPFGLKNAGATYQRLVDNAFEGQVGRNLEVYVDDLVIKSHTEDELIGDGRQSSRVQQNTKRSSNILQLISPRTMKKSITLNGNVARFEQIPIQSGRQVTPLSQTTQKCAKKGDFVGHGSIRSFHAAQAAYISTSPPNASPIMADYPHRKNQKPYIVLPRAKSSLPEPMDLIHDGSSIVYGDGRQALILNNPRRNGISRTALHNMVSILDKNQVSIPGFDSSKSHSASFLGVQQESGCLKEDASTSFRALNKAVLVEILNEQIQLGDGNIYGDRRTGITWMNPIVEFINTGNASLRNKRIPVASRPVPRIERFELLEGVPLSTFGSYSHGSVSFGPISKTSLAARSMRFHAACTPDPRLVGGRGEP
ncbi:hypothetical protein Tco_0437875 [Tanacetum coccineum]